ncbi:hypothetical protein M0802_010279 [Mischocyttarus mexicanus]|nr:hypothetical protein M0802_010279 [Mischocyttarus mexicanus]
MDAVMAMGGGGGGSGGTRHLIKNILTLYAASFGHLAATKAPNCVPPRFQGAFRKTSKEASEHRLSRFCRKQDIAFGCYDQTFSNRCREKLSTRWHPPTYRARYLQLEYSPSSDLQIITPSFPT